MRLRILLCIDGYTAPLLFHPKQALKTVGDAAITATLGIIMVGLPALDLRIGLNPALMGYGT